MKKTLTLIGNGNMALSIAQGMKENYNIEVVGRNMLNLDTFEEALGVTIEKAFLNNFDITDKTVILCVKPYNLVAGPRCFTRYLQGRRSPHSQTTSRRMQWYGLCRTLPLPCRGR